MAKTKTSTLTREQYLNKAVDLLRPWFKKAGHEIPKEINVTCGWPSSKALGRKKRAVGECWPTKASKRKHNEIFISPFKDLFVAGKQEQCVGEILVHELSHAVDDCEHAHKAPFVKIARAVGLDGKPTSTFPNDELWHELKRLEQKLGRYPHAQLDATKLDKKPQTTRLIKAECKTTEYCVRITRKWLEEYGAPICPCCKKAMSYDIPDELEAD